MKIIVNGAGGRMGGILCRMIEEGGKHTLVGKVDKYAEGYAKSLSEITEKADAVIDFSHHSAVPALMEEVTAMGLPVVVCTTGLCDEETNAVKRASEKVPVFFSANMSLGVALLCDLARTAAKTMVGADIEIVEAHHNRKLDAPSGTALMLANAIREVLPEKQLNCGRSGQQKREKDEIGMHAIRMGNVVGMHEIHIATDTQIITLRHEAQDRGVFAEGAIRAMEFLANKSAGLYCMEDLLKEG
ncbi:MAG: 4-hydroxy-tetrahydrodipicolinate reductase [Ruminococcaceae bacterium]|nr:4-hydroxy-tetrahydrodipicolinate reductase [Oscillospiraceae bacterium]